MRVVYGPKMPSQVLFALADLFGINNPVSLFSLTVHSSACDSWKRDVRGERKEEIEER